MNQARSASIVVEGVQVAQQVEGDLEVTVGQRRGLRDERLEHEPLGVGAGGGDDVVLHAGEDGPGVRPLVDAALEPARDAADHVLLAEAQHRELVVRVEQPGLLVPGVAPGQQVAHRLHELVHRRPLDDGLDRQAGDEAGHAELVHLLELAGVVGEQALGDQLEQDVVVALEGGEDVGVGLQRGEPVLAEVARAAARLAALLDGAGGVPGAEGLGAGGARLQHPPGVLVAALLDRAGAGEHLVQLPGDDLLREVEGVRPRDERQQAALVHAVVEEHLLLVGRRSPRTGGGARSSGWRWRAPPSTR